MGDLNRIQRDILDATDRDGTCVTFIRRRLDRKYEVNITYPVVYSQLEALSRAGYLRPDESGGADRYALAERP